MDALSQLLALAGVRVILDVRCLFGGRFDIHHEPLPDGEAAFHLLLSGCCQIRLSHDRQLNLKGGDFVLLLKGEMHTVANAPSVGDAASDDTVRPIRYREGSGLPLKYNDACGEDGAAHLLCGRYRYARGAGSRFAAWLPDVMHVSLLDAADGSTLNALMELLRAEATCESQPGTRAVLDGLGQALLGFGLRVYVERQRATAGVLSLMTDSRLGPSVSAVMAAPGHPWTIAELGSTVAMSRATYARHFQATAGFSVGEFLMQVRMKHACVLLEQGDRCMADIAEAVGYGSEAAFGNAFRQAVGETPRRWQRLRREGVAG